MYMDCCRRSSLLEAEALTSAINPFPTTVPPHRADIWTSRGRGVPYLRLLAALTPLDDCGNSRLGGVEL